MSKILHPELSLGVVSKVSAGTLGINLFEAGRSGGSHFDGNRYGRGEVGEIVLVEGQINLILARFLGVELRETERRAVTRDFSGKADLDAVGIAQILGTVSLTGLRVSAGIDSYPRLGDRVYAAPKNFLALLPELMEQVCQDKSEPITLTLGSVSKDAESPINVRPERLFGRHCAILGATGGGKSWTTTRIIEECLKHHCKIILIDATGEYRSLNGDKISHCHLGTPVEIAALSAESSLPPTCFQESDFFALFEPSGKVQGPKLRAALRSLRLARLLPNLARNGYIPKANQLKAPIERAEENSEIAKKLIDPRQSFDVSRLLEQIESECVYLTNRKEPQKWGDADDTSLSYCLPLLSRISGILTSPAFSFVFSPSTESLPLTEQISEFVELTNQKRLLRICLSGVSYEHRAREIVANVIGRYLLSEARNGRFRNKPLVVFVDEAHNFLGKHIGSEDFLAKLDSFELIAKEGRKYGLNVCLASQRPRDITEGVLSQIGTLIVHRLTNDRDREVVERACGEIDRTASSFLPNLRQGEAAIIGTDFPVPLKIQILPPLMKPHSDGSNYQDYWRGKEAAESARKETVNIGEEVL